MGRRPSPRNEKIFVCDESAVSNPVEISATDYLLTEGDARFAPDPPVASSQVLGSVVAVEIDGQWQPTRASGAWSLAQALASAP